MGCVHGKCCCYSCCQPSSRHENNGGGVGGDKDKEDHSVGARGDGNRPLIENPPVSAALVPSHGIRLEYASLTLQGHYPDSPDRENQDCFLVETHVQGNPNAHLFAVFDGHGQFGTQCAHFVKDRLLELLVNDPSLPEDPAKAYASAFRAANVDLHESEIDDSMSGTTAIAVLVVGDTLHVANVGDSRAVAGVWNGGGGVVVAKDLSRDQTPFRKDEYERVKICGARVLSVDQVEGIKDPRIQSWGDEDDDEGDPPRLWVQNGMYPGTAFTRSIGDSTAEKIGVTAEPEVLMVKITPDHLFFVVASDGVFEFLPSQAVVDMVAQYKDPRDACSAITTDSYRIWLEHESRTDDITVIVVHIKDACNSGTASASDGSTHGNNKASQLAGDMPTVGGHSPLKAILHEESSSQSQGCPVDAIVEKTSASVATLPTPA